MSSREVKEYLSHHHIPQLLESLLTGLLYSQPDDPVSFLQTCLITTRQLGGPNAVTWDMFIHLERHQLTSTTPPKKTSTPANTTTIPSTTPPVPSVLLSELPRTNTHPKPKTTPSVLPKTTLLPATTSPILQITPQIHSMTSLTLPKTTAIPPLKLQTAPASPQTTTATPQSLHPTPQIIPPTLPSSIILSHFGPKVSSIKPKVSFLTPVTSHISCTNNTTPASESELLLSAPPGPVMTPPIHIEGKEQRDMKSLSTEAPPPGLPPSRVWSQLSIDSDSDMTESSGLLQEVSILPPQRPRPFIIFIIGGPASGKGSQAASLARCFNLRAISLDEVLRRQLLSHASPSRKWEVISEMMSHGELGPQEETVSELRRQLTGQPQVRGFIVDGFPRDVHQALSFQEKIGSPDLVMLLLCSNETLHCRLCRRAAQLGLLGDSSHALRRRLETFQRDIVSIKRYYRQLHLLTQVDADRDEEVVFTDLSSVIRERLLLLKDSSDPDGLPEYSSAVLPGSPV